MRLIDADALIDDIKNNLWDWETVDGITATTVLKQTISDIRNQPTIEERKTGKWINNIHDIPICDQCGYMTPYDRAIDDYEYGNYCPNCGADMREQS